MVRRSSKWLFMASLLLLPVCAWAQPRGLGTPRTPTERVAEERTGTVVTREGMLLRLVTDTGSVRILPQPSGSPQVSYRVRVETDSTQPEAQKLLKQFVVVAVPSPEGVLITGTVPWRHFRGRLWISFEVQVPQSYNLEVQTSAGNITTGEINGRVSLSTGGGNIGVARIGGPARLETMGGHISTQDVTGDLFASTAGGHIVTGNVQGEGVLRTGGGHIRVASILGLAQLETGGGNITVQRSGSKALATSTGGQIVFGEAAGSIQARTGGGGIKVLRVAGPVELQTGGGSIYLSRVEAPVSASTPMGNITAFFASEGKWVSADPRKKGVSQLQCGQGDIVVYLSRELALTIEATIEQAVDHQVNADPGLELKYVEAPAGLGQGEVRLIRAVGALNGGGEVLRLRTVAGNISLRYAQKLEGLDPQEQKLLLQMYERRREEQERMLQRRLEPGMRREEKLGPARKAPSPSPERSPMEVFQQKLGEIWTRPLRVDAESQGRKVIHQPRPNYPEVARRARIQGRVQMEVLIHESGVVESINVLSGNPVLVEAAKAAVAQWRYAPTVVRGRPMKVITQVEVAFQLKD